MEKGPIILIVDDNVFFIERMLDLLSEITRRINIQFANDFDEGKRIFIRESPDFVLLDINLPGRNGIELLKFIKHSDKECEVIMISNHADEYYRTQCIESGARYFLDKSNEFMLVSGIITSHLNKLHR